MWPDLPEDKTKACWRAIVVLEETAFVRLEQEHDPARPPLQKLALRQVPDTNGRVG
jgi:hypothetical protein